MTITYCGQTGSSDEQCFEGAGPTDDVECRVPRGRETELGFELYQKTIISFTTIALIVLVP